MAEDVAVRRITLRLCPEAGCGRLIGEDEQRCAWCEWLASPAGTPVPPRVLDEIERNSRYRPPDRFTIGAESDG